MSELNVTTLGNQTGTKTVPTETVVAGSAKAWVNFNGTGTVAIRDSFNVSSITDNAVGDYTVNFSTDMSSVDYCPVSMSTRNSGFTQPRQTIYAGGTKTVGALQVIIEVDSGTNTDVDFIFCVVFSN